MPFQNRLASLIVGRKFTIFALIYYAFEGNFQIQAPQGAYIWRGNLTGVFLHYKFQGLIFGGAYTWRGSFFEFYGIIVDSRQLQLSREIVKRSSYWQFRANKPK